LAERTTANVADPANVPPNSIRHRGGRRIGLDKSPRSVVFILFDLSLIEMLKPGWDSPAKELPKLAV
jgi:hypothetical protein